jgi:hypothetical protein
MAYSENGPNINTDNNRHSQLNLFQDLSNYTLTEDVVSGTDYILVDTINDIEYYTPNDEDWGPIIAVSDEHKLATNTTFYDMDDMDYPDSDYAMVVVDGVMGCRFSLEN